MIKPSASRTKQLIRTLRKFRADREEFIEACESQVWKQFGTSPHFYLQWAVANMTADIAADVAVFVLKHDKKYKFYDIADTIRDIYTNPEKWVLDDSLNLKQMLAKYGQPE